MGIFNSIKRRLTGGVVPSGIKVGGVKGARNNSEDIASGSKSREYDLLERLKCTPDVYDAIDLINDKHPDAAMAVQSYVRLCSTGHNMEFFTGEGNKEIDVQLAKEWREFASKSTFENPRGFDSIIEQCHSSLVKYGEFGIEVTVGGSPLEITGIYPILPKWVDWERDKRTGEWVPYQNQGSKRVDLRTTNFFWITVDGKVGTPKGRVMMESSLMAIESQLEFFRDTSQVLRRAGYPRNDISIDRKAVFESAPNDIRQNGEKLQKWFDTHFNSIVSQMRTLEPTDDYVHYDDVVVNKSTGADQSRGGIDMRAHAETIDAQVINGLGIMSVFLNRTSGITETWGTVQFKIVTDTVKAFQNCSKRIAENIANMWLQLKGIQGYAKLTHKPLDFEAEKTKAEIALQKLEINRRAEEYGYIDKASAAKDSMGVSELPKEPPEERVEYISKIV